MIYFQVRPTPNPTAPAQNAMMALPPSRYAQVSASQNTNTPHQMSTHDRIMSAA